MIGSVTPLTAAGAPGLQLKVVTYQRLNRIRDNNCARGRQARDPGRHVGGQPGEVASGAVQIHQTAVHPHPHIDAETESPSRLNTEPGHLPRDLQPRVYRPVHIVFVPCGRSTSASAWPWAGHWRTMTSCSRGRRDTVAGPRLFAGVRRAAQGGGTQGDPVGQAAALEYLADARGGRRRRCGRRLARSHRAHDSGRLWTGHRRPSHCRVSGVPATSIRTELGHLRIVRRPPQTTRSTWTYAQSGFSLVELRGLEPLT